MPDTHERARIFIEKNGGEFNALKYMGWIRRCSHNYRVENNIHTITDQDAFTEYLKEQNLEGEFLKSDRYFY